MNRIFIRCFLTLFLVVSGLSVWAVEKDRTVVTPGQETVAACQAMGEGFDPGVQLAQSSCCKGRKGVCGCRAGKIVCCDGKPDRTCSCHGDDDQGSIN